MLLDIFQLLSSAFVQLNFSHLCPLKLLRDGCECSVQRLSQFESDMFSNVFRISCCPTPLTFSRIL